MLETKAKKTKWGYRGYVECWDVNPYSQNPDKKFKIWSEKAGPHRLTKEDALEDAIQLKKYRDPLY